MASNPIPAWWGKNKKKVYVVGAVLLVLWIFFGRGGNPETEKREIPEGLDSAGREVFVHAPSDPPEAVPLVLILHDEHSSAADIERASDASQLADRRDFAVVYPEALHGTWVPDPEVPNSQHLRDIVQYMVGLEDSKINRDRIYIWGYGQGGELARDVACAGDGLFAAVGVVGGQFAGTPPSCGPDGAVKVISVPEDAWTEDTTDLLWDGSQP